MAIGKRGQLIISTQAAGQDPGDRVEQAQTTGRFSPLELYHPSGFVRNARVIGSACPDQLLPGPDVDDADDKPADLIIFAPSPRECLSAGWLNANLSSIDQQLQPDGIFYGLVPPPWRYPVQTLLRRQGFTDRLPILHLPDRRASRYLVPLKSAPAHYAFNNLIPTRRWKRSLFLNFLRFDVGEKLISCSFPSAGFFVRRPGGLPLLDWLFQVECNEPRRGLAILSANWRTAQGSFVFHVFCANRDPSAVIKLGWGADHQNSSSGDRSAATRAQIDAQKSGARLPKPLWSAQIGQKKAFAETCLPGQTMASILYQYPEEMKPALERTAGWIEAWNLKTLVHRPVDDEMIARQIFRPLAGLFPQEKGWEEYASWLKNRFSRINDRVPLVACHNDLTTWNVLLDGDGQLGVVDWSQAQEEFLPLTDFLYFLLDAVVMAEKIRRDKAFEACFLPGGEYSSQAKRNIERFVASLDIPREMVDLCIHICFLHHAINELGSSGSEEERSFLIIARQASASRDRIYRWVNS